MNDKGWFWTLLIGLIYVAILFVLVKPGSPGADAVKGLSNALSSLVTTATGGTPATSQ
jgi:hypothetical protein